MDLSVKAEQGRWNGTFWGLYSVTVREIINLFNLSTFLEPCVLCRENPLTWTREFAMLFALRIQDKR